MFRVVSFFLSEVFVFVCWWSDGSQPLLRCKFRGSSVEAKILLLTTLAEPSSLEEKGKVLLHDETNCAKIVNINLRREAKDYKERVLL